MNNNIREMCFIGPRCRERFLPLLENGPLRQAGVISSGVSDLKGKYVISRVNPCFCLVLGTLAGQARLLTPQKECRLSPSDLLIAPAGSQYRYELAGGKLWRIVWFHLAPAAHPEWFKHLSGLMIIPSFELQHLEREALDLVEENERRQFMAFQARQAKEEYLTVQIQRIFLTVSGAAPQSYGKALFEMWRKVMDQPARKWTLRELAELAGYSAGHLNRLCRRQYGHAAIKHLAELKMQYAYNLLVQGIFKVQAVAEKCGYQNEFAFSTAFKRHFKVPPRRIMNLDYHNRDNSQTEEDDIGNDKNIHERQMFQKQRVGRLERHAGRPVMPKRGAVSQAPNSPIARHLKKRLGIFL